jgi:TP901 family phage tail tape measure protein
MADFEAKFGVNIDTSEALASIKQLQSQISAFHRQLAKGSALNANQQQNLQRNLIADINSSGKFAASMQRVHSTTENFTNALEKNKLSMGQYFRYAGGASKTFGRRFISEFSTIEKVARERVKTLQTQYIAMGRDANGALQSIAVRPLKLDMNNLATQTAINAQKQQIFNQLLRQGSTNLLNFGKNTQWAGRQLMVGFTIPLSIFGTMAGKTFMEVEQQAIRFRRVYGELFTPPAEANDMLRSLKELASEFTKYGVSLEKTLSLASDVAAMGKTGNDLLAQVSEATRLSVLGEVDQAKALEATISVSNAFGIAAEDLAGKIDFLNAVENQTVTAIEDLTIAIPKAGPVIQQLGGSVEDLAYFLTAMKEGGINASEGANALKSGLARIINPTEKASDMLKALGININQIVEGNAGDIKTTVTEIAFALDALDPLARSRAIEELFGKFQFARISTLFQNITKDGSQAARVLDLATASTQELANLSEKELGAVAESTTFAFKKAFEDLRIAIAPIGEQFLKAVTPIIEFAAKILKSFDNMSDGAKNFVVILTAVLGAVAPVALMTFGLLANGVANILKGFAALRGMFLKTAQDTTILGNQTEYMTQEQLVASAASASLEQAHMRLTQQFTSETTAVQMLAEAYGRAAIAAQRLTSVAPIPTSIGKGAMKGYAKGGIISGAGTGTSDSILAKVSNGEAIIPADVVSKNPGFFRSMIAGKIPGFAEGGIVNVGGSEGKNYSVPDGRSVKAIQSIIDKLSAAGHSFEAITVILDNLESQSEMTAGALREEAKSRGMLAQNSGGVSRAHLTMPRDGGDGFSYLSGLTRETSSEQNYKLRSGQNKDEFLTEWNSRSGGLTSAGQAGMRQTGDLGANESISREHIAALQELDTEIGKLAAEMAVDGLVSDTELAKAAEIVIKKSQNAPGAKGQAARGLEERRTTETARRTKIDTAKINEGISTGEVNLKAGTVTLVDSSGKTVGRVGNEARDAAMSAGSESEKRAILQAARKKSSTEGIAGTRSYVGYKNVSSDPNQSAKLEGVGEKDEKAYNKGRSKVKPKDSYVRNRQRNSPHAKAGPDGADDAKAYSSSFDKTIKRVGSRRVQSANIDAASDTPVKRSGSRRAISPQQTASRDEAIRKQQEKQTLAQSEATKVATGKLQRMSGAMSTGIFALTSLAGVGSMMGGRIGELSGIIFKFSGVAFALIQVTQMLTSMKFLEFLASRKLVAAKAVEAATAAGGGKFKVAGAAVSAFLGGPFKLGLIAAGLALAGLIAVIAFFVNKQKKAQEQIENLGKAANLSADKLKTLAQITGKDISGGNIGQLSAGGTVSGDMRDKVQSLSQSDQLKEAFASEISGLENATTDQAKLIMQNIARRLAASGLEQEDVEPILRALGAAAGRSDLKLNFKSLDVGNESLSAAVSSLTDGIQDDLDKSVGTMQNYGRSYSTALTDAQRASVVYKNSQEEIVQVAATLANGLVSVGSELQNGTMSADEAESATRQLLSGFSSLDSEMQALIIPDIAEQLGIDDPKIFENLTNISGGLAVLKAIALGMNVDPSMLALFASDSKDANTRKDQAMAQRFLNEQVSKYLDLTEEQLKQKDEQAVKDKAIADLGTFQEDVSAMEDKKKAYEELITAGKKHEEAMEIVSDANMLAAYSSAMAADAQDKANGIYSETENNVGAFEALLAAAKAAELPDLKPGGSRTNPYEDAIKSLQEQKKAAENASSAYSKLRKAGFSIADANKAASDSTTALALSTAKVGTKKYEDLVRLLKEVDKLSKQNGIKDLIRDRSQGIQMKSQFMSIVPILQEMGIAAEDVVAILDNPDIANAFIADLKDGVLDAKNLQNYLKQIEMMKKIQVQIDLVTPENQWAKVDGAFSDISKWFSTKEASIDIKFRPQIDAVEKIIKSAEDEIENYNSQISENEYQLSGIERAETAINEKYDKRINALESIKNINKLIQSQEKASLNVADALSRGDIAAAARAAQEARAEEASNQAEAMQKNLETAKTKEIAALTSKNGKTRLELEKEITDYKLQIEKIEHDTLVPQQRALANLNGKVEAEKAALSYLGQTKTAWGDVETAANLARVEAEAYLKAIEDALALLPGLTDGKIDPLGVGKKAGNAGGASSQEAELNRLIKITRDRVQGGDFTDNAQKQRLMAINVERIKELRDLTGNKTTVGGMSMGGMVPKYFASGGFAIGTDTVPAMLTPGEFVVNRGAVKNFGADRLRAINSGASSSDSVYNYNLSVNVKSDANPDQIANAVMHKIKSIDSQRIRGGR